MSDQPPKPETPAGLSADELRALADKRNRAIDTMSSLIDKRGRAQQAVVDRMR